MAHLRLYGVAIAQYSEDQKVLVQIFPNNLTGPTLTLYTQLDLSKIKTWDDLGRTFISHYKYNVDIHPNRYELQKSSRKVVKVQRICPVMESPYGSGEAKSNRLRDYIDLSVNFEKALLCPHDWISHYEFCHPNHNWREDPGWSEKWQVYGYRGLQTRVEKQSGNTHKKA